ncbi:hypothetical protein ACFLWC_05085 [Chloroflexota bacterium]
MKINLTCPGEVPSLYWLAIGIPPEVTWLLMSEFQIDSAKIEVLKGKANVKGALTLNLSGDGVDISDDITVTLGPLSETIPEGTIVEKKGKWEYKQPKGVEGVIKNMKIDWKKGKFEFSIDKADLGGLTEPNNVTISIQVGDDYGQKTITMKAKHGKWEYKG